MSFFHLRTLAGNGWPALPNPQFSLLWSAYQQLDRTQWLDAPALERGQLVQLRTLLAHCREHVPYYRRVLREAGVDAAGIRSAGDFRRVPVLTRHGVQQSAPDLQAAVLPAGTVAGDTITTSGSSGVPVTVRLTNASQLWWFACYLRDLEWSGLDPRGRLASIRYFKTTGEAGRQALEGVRVPCWNDVLAQLVENGPSYGMDVHQDPRRQLDWLRRVDPDYLLSFPSNLEFLARLAAESGVRLPKLRAIQAISETLTDEARAGIESAFGVPVRNTYSCAEAGYLASPCPAGHGLHVHAENVYLEVLDDAGDPVAPGETGRVVLTTLHNFRTPFVRYEVMDRATVAAGPCPCGRGLPLLTAVSGKSHPVLRLPDGSWQNSSRLAVRMRKIGGFYQFRITQLAPDRYAVRVIPSAEWSPDHAGRVVDMVREFCRHAVEVTVETATHRELSAAGKAADIVVAPARPPGPGATG